MTHPVGDRPTLADRLDPATVAWLKRLAATLREQESSDIAARGTNS